MGMRDLLERITSAQERQMKKLKPNDRVVVYHGTTESALPGFINGFDATEVRNRSYGGPKHRGLFITLDPDVAQRFSSYGNVILKLNVRAKQLHGVDWNGVIGRRNPYAGEIANQGFQDSFRPYLSHTMTSSSEPQGLLVGLVSPRQIVSIRFQGEWYSRKELLSMGAEITLPGNSGRDKETLSDFGVDLSSTRTGYDELVRATARMHGKTPEGIESTFSRWASMGTDRMEYMLDRLGFKRTAARALAKKIVRRFS